MMTLDDAASARSSAGPDFATERVEGGMHPVAVARRLQVTAMDTDAPRVFFGDVPVTCPTVAMAPQISVSRWRVPPQPDLKLLLTSSTTLQIDALQVVYEWTSEDDVGTIMRALRVVPQRATTLDDALLARDEPEGASGWN